MLSGKTALVTGSTSGIGLAIAEQFAKAGAHIVLNGFGDAAEIATLRERLTKEHGVQVHYNGADMSKPDAIEAMFKEIDAKFGGIDILVNNAGIQFVAPVDEFPVAKWDAIMAINLTASFHTIRLALPGMKKKTVGPHHPDRLGPRAGGVALQVGLRRGQTRHCRPDQNGGAGGGRAGHHRQRHLPRLRLDARWWKSRSPRRPRPAASREEEVIQNVLLTAQPTKQFVTVEQVAALASYFGQRRRSLHHRRGDADRRRLDRPLKDDNRMNIKDILALPSMPAASPSYPRGPYRFIDREYLIITYESDPQAIRDALPEPLEPDGSNTVLYEFIRMPDSAGFGSYTESGVVIPALYRGEHVNFTAQMYLDDEPPIAGGREIWGFPKKHGQPKLCRGARHADGHAGLRWRSSGRGHHGLQAPAFALRRGGQEAVLLCLHH